MNTPSPNCQTSKPSHGGGCHSRGRTDYLLWGSALFILAGYLLWISTLAETLDIAPLTAYTESIAELIHRMWWSMLLGVFSVGLLSNIPREWVTAILGRGGGFPGIFRATLAGLLLDLCNHGIIMVGMKLYERGASLGQTMAFLIASPWNSLTLTLVLWSLIGLPWTLTFIVLSMVIALISGRIFDALVASGTLPANTHEADLPEGFRLRTEVRRHFKNTTISASSIARTFMTGLRESRMVMRWLLFGIVLTAIIRTFVSDGMFNDWFGPTLMGLALTIVAATIIEVCSEGSVPLAADLHTRAGAPGNAFTFLMTGASTDYTEIMALRETTRSWKISLFLPLVTLPQIVAMGWLLNSVP